MNKCLLDELLENIYINNKQEIKKIISYKLMYSFFPYVKIKYSKRKDIIKIKIIPVSEEFPVDK